jgi:hypothetical protein
MAAAGHRTDGLNVRVQTLGWDLVVAVLIFDGYNKTKSIIGTLISPTA